MGEASALERKEARNAANSGSFCNQCTACATNSSADSAVKAGSPRLQLTIAPERDDMVLPAKVSTGTPIQTAWHDVVKPVNGKVSRIMSTC